MTQPFNVCPKQQCRGRTDHSTVRHWTPVYLNEVAYIVDVHAKGTCGCGKPLLVDLSGHAWSTVRYFAREAKRWFGHRVLHRDW